MKSVMTRTMSRTIFSACVFTLAWTSFVLPEAIGADIAKGKAIYDRQCALCHGRAGRGDGPVAKSLNPTPPSFISKEMIGHPDDRHRKVIMEGEGPMPSFKGQLSQEEINDVLAYTRSLAK